MSRNRREWGGKGEGNLLFFGRGDLAFTGLEAALILIAFIVVAAVFSYTTLNTGFMVTQQSRNTIFTSVEQTTSTLDLSGDVYGIGGAGISTEMYRINFTCRIAPSGSPVDFEKVVMTYSNSSYMENLWRDPTTYNPSGCLKNSGSWAVYQKTGNNGPGNNLINESEMFFVSACPSQPIVGGDSFNLEVIPSIGVALSLNRRVPNHVSTVTSLP